MVIDSNTQSNESKFTELKTHQRHFGFLQDFILLWTNMMKSFWVELHYKKHYRLNEEVQLMLTLFKEKRVVSRILKDPEYFIYQYKN